MTIQKRLDSIDVHIIKMRESSGNEQFFIRLVRTDGVKKTFDTSSYLEYNCWQTKTLPKDECLQRAWFDASMLARFSGLSSMDEVKLFGLDDDEIKILKSSHSMLREKKNK